MTGLIHAAAILIQRSRRQHTNRPSQHGRRIRQNIAKHITGHHHIKLLWLLYQLHRRVIHIHMAQLYLRIVRRHLRDHLTPQNGCFQHIGLVHRTETLTPHHRRFKGHATNTTNLRLIVFVGVIPLALTILQNANTPRLTKVNTTHQLANNLNIQSRDKLRLQ